MENLCPGIDIDTFALGGDSRVGYGDGELFLCRSGYCRFRS